MPAGSVAALVASLSVLLSVAFFVSTFRFPLFYDSANYWHIAHEFAERGIFADYTFSSFRTYGYPWVISLLLPAEKVGINARLLIFLLQLGLYLGGALLVRRELPERLGGAVFVGLCLNLFVLAYLPEVLTDSFGAALLPLLAWALLRGGRLEIVFGSLLVGFLVAVRPGNVCLLPAWGVALLVLSWPGRWRAITVAGVLAAISIALPLVPQVVNNVRYHNALTPLIAEDYAGTQHMIGARALKYATGWPDSVGKPVEYVYSDYFDGTELHRVFYENPFFSGTISRDAPLRWYAENPWHGALTAALHLFALVDVDLLFVFSPNLAPSYRWPLGLLNHLGIALAIVALVTARRWGTGSVLAIAAAYVAGMIPVYAISAVESRFGLPMLVAIGPLAAIGLRQLAEARQRAVIVTACALYVFSALSLSEWMRDQAPFIRAHRAVTDGEVCGGFGGFLDDMFRRHAFGRTAPSVSREQFMHSVAEHVAFVQLRKPKDGQPLRIAVAMTDGGTEIAQLVRTGWGVDVRLSGALGDAAGKDLNSPEAWETADLLVLTVDPPRRRPARYPCIDGRRVADDSQREVSTQSLEALRRQRELWSEWVTITGPYYNAVIFQRVLPNGNRLTDNVN